MKRRLKWLVLALVLLVLGGLVARSLMARKAEQAKLAAPPRAGLAIELALGDVVIAARTDITRTLDISGGLKAVETAVVKARVAAEVTSLTVREGDRVKAGQLLGRLDATEFSWRLRQAEDQSQSARSQLEIAQRTLDNNRALVDQGFISKSALDTSVFGANGAQALLQSAQASAELRASRSKTRRSVRPCRASCRSGWCSPASACRSTPSCSKSSTCRGSNSKPPWRPKTSAR